MMFQLNKSLPLSGIPSLFKHKFDGHVVTVIPIPYVCIFRNIILRNICLLMPCYKDFLLVLIIKICFSSNFKINSRCLYTNTYIWRYKSMSKIVPILKHKTMKHLGEWRHNSTHSQPWH
jgi:hypothetical protein